MIKCLVLKKSLMINGFENIFCLMAYIFITTTRLTIAATMIILRISANRTILFINNYFINQK